MEGTWVPGQEPFQCLYLKKRGRHVAHNQARIATPWGAQNTNYQYAFAVHARGHAHEGVSRMHEPKTGKNT